MIHLNNKLPFSQIDTGLKGVFWGKSFTFPKHANDLGLCWQKAILDIDRWVANEAEIGLIGNDVFFLSFGSNNSNEFHGCFRRLYGPQNRFINLLQNNLDGWEAYVVNMDSGTLDGQLGSFSWIWSKTVQLDWKKSNILRFTKL